MAKRIRRIRDRLGRFRTDVLMPGQTVAGLGNIPGPESKRPRPVRERRVVARAGIPIIRRDPILNREEFEHFGCDVPALGPPTPDALVPDVVVPREFFGNLDLVMPDGVSIRFWGFRSPDNPAMFPNEAIRVRQGQVVHTPLKVRKNVHTIHHHGIEGTTFNDGVGHVSFEVKNRYTYQWRPHEAGTFFYHCHVNTTLHVEMGMYGMLIVDPPEGPGTAFEGGPVYDVEGIWAFDEVDPRFHKMSHHEGINCLFDKNAGQHFFRPEYFFISGTPSPFTELDNPPAPYVSPIVNATAGQRILIRMLCGGYTINRITFPFPVQIIAVDGIPLGGPANPRTQYAAPIDIPAGQPIEMTTAQRHDIYIPSAPAGNHAVTITFNDWVDDQEYATVTTFVIVQ